MFELYDVDGDGVVSVGDVEALLRMAAGEYLAEDEVHQLAVAGLANRELKYKIIFLGDKGAGKHFLACRITVSRPASKHTHAAGEAARAATLLQNTHAQGKKPAPLAPSPETTQLQFVCHHLRQQQQ